MLNEELSELAKDPRFISGIYNYCDRWCERCPFSARCLVYANEVADPGIEPANRDASNEAFWQEIASILAETREMVAAFARDNGIDTSPSALAAVQEDIEERRVKTRKHPLAKAAEHYALLVEEWFKSEITVPQACSDRSDEVQSENSSDEYLSVVRWDQFFIAAKLIRALRSRGEGLDCDDNQSRDSNGSAKAALVAIDRSLSAWKFISESQRETSGSIPEILIKLEKLRVNAEMQFPNARDFIRPGFDETDLDTLH